MQVEVEVERRERESERTVTIERGCFLKTRKSTRKE